MSGRLHVSTLLRRVLPHGSQQRTDSTASVVGDDAIMPTVSRRQRLYDSFFEPATRDRLPRQGRQP